MRKIHLHGALGEKFGKVFELEVETVGEAVRALGTNFPDIVPALRDQNWHVVRGDPDTGLALGDDDINTFKLGRADLHLVPAVAGSKNSTAGTIKIVLGVALIGLSFYMGFATPILGAAAAGGMLGGLTYGNLAVIGLALALSGVSQLLSPEEKATDEDKQNSFVFAGPGNSYEQGAPVPLVYGEVITGSVMISGGIDIERIEVGA